MGRFLWILRVGPMESQVPLRAEEEADEGGNQRDVAKGEAERWQRTRVPCSVPDFEDRGD